MDLWFRCFFIFSPPKTASFDNVANSSLKTINQLWNVEQLATFKTLQNWLKSHAFKRPTKHQTDRQTWCDVKWWRWLRVTLYVRRLLPLQALLLQLPTQALRLPLVAAGRLLPPVQVPGDRRQAAVDGGDRHLALSLGLVARPPEVSLAPGRLLLLLLPEAGHLALELLHLTCSRSVRRRPRFFFSAC